MVDITQYLFEDQLVCKLIASRGLLIVYAICTSWICWAYWAVVFSLWKTSFPRKSNHTVLDEGMQNEVVTIGESKFRYHEIVSGKYEDGQYLFVVKNHGGKKFRVGMNEEWQVTYIAPVV